MKKLFDRGVQAVRDAAYKARFGVTESEERETREKGLEGLKAWNTKMYETFAQRFKPEDRQATEGLYQAAKRAETVVMGCMNEIVYGSSPLGFGDIYSALGAATHHEAPETRARVAEFAEKRIAHLEELAAEIISVMTPPEDHPAQVIPLKGGPKPGVNVNDFPDTRQYIDELRTLEARVKQVLEPMKGVHGVGAIMRADDIAAIASAYKTVQLDLLLWKAGAADFRSKDSRRYNYGILEDLNSLTTIHEGIGRLVHEHERAFSTDGLSASDRAFLYWTGTRVDSPEAAMGQKPRVGEVPAQFADPLQYCSRLGLTGADFVGKTQSDIRSMLKKIFYPLAARLHPDNRPPEEKLQADREFAEVGSAYETLADEDKRTRYFAGETRGV